MTEQATSHGAAATALAGGEQAAGGAAAAAAAPAGGAAAATEKFWYSDLPPELQGNLEKKGWNNPTALPNVVKSYFELEKLNSSSEKINFPKDDSDPKAFDPIYNKLGRPESPDKYVFPDGVDQNTVKTLAPKLHELGITQKQANALATIDIERQQAFAESERVRVVNDQNQADVVLHQEWGSKYSENMEFARRAMRGLGMNLDQGFIPMAAAIGAKNALKLLHLAGLNTREDNAAAIGDAQAGFGMTPNRANAELQEKGPELLRRARDGDASAKAHWQRLNRAIAGDGFVEI
jgi:hypothetical protein